MIKNIFTIAAVVSTLSVTSAVASSRLDEALDLTPEPKVEEVAGASEKPKEDTTLIKCLTCTKPEQKALKFFQTKGGVRDKYALAMIMGSIKQESRFQPTVCEGGFLTSWRGCTRGGFGLIQFTSSHRYHGLARYAWRTGQQPESMDAQLEYIITEPEWLNAAAIFKQEGLPMYNYERAGYIWLGYGIKGNRTWYANQYVKQFA